MRARSAIRAREWREQYPERNAWLIKNATYKKKYGINYDSFVEMVFATDFKCEICGVDLILEGRNSVNKAVLDHCHDTGNVRGVLCHLCNAGIGLFREKKELLIEAIKYLEKASG